MTEKLAHLKVALRDMGSVAVAFSAGEDSTFLLRVAHEELGDRAMAVTVRSPLIPPHELDDAAAFAARKGSGTRSSISTRCRLLPSLRILPTAATTARRKCSG